MGTWGIGILQDDFARDIFDEYIELFQAGKSHAQILKDLRKSNPDAMDDKEDDAIYWLAVARAQWECGGLSPTVLASVKKIVAKGTGLALWAEAGPKSLAKRKEALAQFVAKLETANPRPRQRRKPVTRNPIFEPGECLAYRCDDGQWTAAIVLACPPEHPKAGREAYGQNIIGVLDYKAKKPPTLADFEKRRWLKVAYELPLGNGHRRLKNYILCIAALRFRAYKDRYVSVGRTELRPTDPRALRNKDDHLQLAGEPTFALSYTSWNLGNVDYWFTTEGRATRSAASKK